MHSKTLSLALSAAIAALSLLATQAPAQTVANGPYYAMPSWDQTLPAASRFIVLSNFESKAVLDRETGLVWERQPSTEPFYPKPTSARPGPVAFAHCVELSIANRKGWRLPKLNELSSLTDLTQASPALPMGHPFTVPADANFWTSEDYFPELFPAVRLYVSVADGRVWTGSDSALAWCVRSGQ
jgi:hypothetical protein